MSRKYTKKHERFGRYKSKLEENVAKILGDKAKYEPEKLQYMLPKKYIPDFVVEANDKKIYIEVKGYLRYEDQQKMRAVKFTNPDLDIRFFFPADNRVHLSKMTNSEWCKKYNFPCYIGKFPRGWLKQ
jgi:predicted nuclease of restriction endonuclease-like RecB superfamily